MPNELELEPNRHLNAGRKPPRMRLAIQTGLNHLREASNHLTGGGLRALAIRLLSTFLRRAISHSFLKAVGRNSLQPFPKLSARLYRLATVPDAIAAKSLVNSFYKAAFGHAAEEAGLAAWVRELRSGMSVEVLAEHFVRLADFQQRHGSSEEVDINYVTALYRDGLGRPPKLEELAFWLAKAEKEATRAKVLAGIDGSDEALARALLPATETGMDYGRWIVAFDTITNADRAAIRTHIAGLPFCPVFSVIMAIGATSESPFANRSTP